MENGNKLSKIYEITQILVKKDSINLSDNHLIDIVEKDREKSFVNMSFDGIEIKFSLNSFNSICT